MQFTNLLTHLPRRGLDRGQEENLEKIFRISERFHREAGIPFVVNDIGSETLVIEAAHQPNFFPYSGTWRKAFLADYIRKRMPDSVSLFGFADYNLSTAQVLSRNKLPAVKKISVEPVGFNIPAKNRWKSFNLLAKPSPDDYEKEIGKIKRHYGQDADGVETVMREAYGNAGNLADMNAFIFSKICASMGVETHFFRYSDVQNEKIFVEEWQKIISSDGVYKGAYNKAVEEKGITDMHVLEKDYAPFWYECLCGGKTPLSYAGEKVSGKCPLCGKINVFDTIDLDKEFPRVRPTAVLRNLVYSGGLGTSIYVSGPGGGLRYGQISEEISTEMGLHIPATIAWKGRDMYMGRIQETMAREIKRLTGARSLVDGKEYRSIKEKKLSELSAGNANGQLTNLRNRLLIAKEVFSMRPSFLDEFIAVDIKQIAKGWDAALSRADAVQAGHVCMIDEDVAFGADTASIYRNLGGDADVQ